MEESHIVGVVSIGMSVDGERMLSVIDATNARGKRRILLVTSDTPETSDLVGVLHVEDALELANHLERAVDAVMVSRVEEAQRRLETTLPDEVERWLEEGGE